MASFHSHHPPEDCLNCEHRHLRMFCNLTPEALAGLRRHRHHDEPCPRRKAVFRGRPGAQRLCHLFRPGQNLLHLPRRQDHDPQDRRTRRCDGPQRRAGQRSPRSDSRSHRALPGEDRAQAGVCRLPRPPRHRQHARRAIALRRIPDRLPRRQTAGPLRLRCRPAGPPAARLGPLRRPTASPKSALPWP